MIYDVHIFDDTGYRAVCPTCGVRHAESRLAVGKPRDVTIMNCKRCEQLEAKRRKDPLIKGQHSKTWAGGRIEH